MSISPICSNKAIIGIFELLLTLIVREVVPLEVMEEDKVLDIINIGDFSTFISTFRKHKVLIGSMGNNFSSSSIFSTSRRNIVIAFNVELEVTFSGRHFIISLLVLIIFLHVIKVVFDLTTAYS